MALLAQTKYSTSLQFASGSDPGTSVSLYADEATAGNEYLVLSAPSASFKGDLQVTGALRTYSDATFNGAVNIDGVTTLTDLRVDNLRLEGNSIRTTSEDGNVWILPDGSGDFIVGCDMLVGNGSSTGAITSYSTQNLLMHTYGGTNSGVIEINAGADGNIDITPNGTGEVNISKVDIDAGTIDGVTIGTNSAVTDLKAGNLRIGATQNSGQNYIKSTDTNGWIYLDPHGSGNTSVFSTLWVGGSGGTSKLTSNYINNDLVIDTYDGLNSGEIKIYSGADGDIDITPNGTGIVNIAGNTTLGDSSDDTVAISGTLGVEADATFNSQNVTLGDSSLAWSRVTLPSNSQINGSLVTYVNGIGGVGTSSARWGSMYSINLDASGDVTLGNTTADSITINGTVSDFTAGVITATELVATSDARLKSNIQDVTNAMDVINSLQGVEYDLIETGEHSMGVLAQELIEVAPALVKTRENGNYAVNYSGLSAFFVEAIKEQQVQIKEQKEQIEELKNLVKELASK